MTNISPLHPSDAHRRVLVPSRSIDGLRVAVRPPLQRPPVQRRSAVASAQRVMDIHPQPAVKALPIKEVVPATEQAAHHQALDNVTKKKVIHRALKNYRRKYRSKRARQLILSKQGGFVALAMMVFIASGYVAADTILTNRHVAAQLTSGTSQAATDPTTPTNAEAQHATEGSDKTQVSAANMRKYAVAPDLPKTLYISKLKITARILPMSVNVDGSVQAPKNIFDSGWYNGSVKPGEIGAMFIDGHSSGSTHEGLFGNLSTLVEGDTLQVEKGDGTRLTYKVVHTAIVDLQNVDMKKLLLPYGNVLRGLNLMTCTGSWINENTKSPTLNQRVEVFTEQIKN